MTFEDKSLIYSNHITFIDKIIIKKRKEIIEIINHLSKDKNFFDVLDVGTTEDTNHESSNIIIKNLKYFKVFKSISIQKINSNFFKEKLTKSITQDFSSSEIEKFKSDVVIANATIEHVGNIINQVKMCKNISLLANKYFIIITPNRYHPLEFHSKLPLIHWLPKKIHRYFLKMIGLKMLSKEENLNLLSRKNLINIMNEINISNYEIKYIKFLCFKSNLVLIGKKS